MTTMTVILGVHLLAVAALGIVIFIVSRWANRVHGLVSGYWFLAWLLWTSAIGLISGPVWRLIIDDHLRHMGLQTISIGELQALSAYVSMTLGVLAKLVLVTLFSSELINVLSPTRSEEDVGWIRRLYPRRHHLGVLAVVLSYVHPLAGVLGLGALELGL